ncbi:MAG TPA: hypothetical protein VEL74_15210 [Thermoanaerobaculia bacterium]|nr:hypothetical protein [Thermoanaerobaculia bacterium]
MKLKTALSLLFATALLALLTAVPASAACTATLNCNNACSVSVVCRNGCEIGCAANGTTASCTGATSCTVGTSSVTCDGTTVSCPSTPRCSSTRTSVYCGFHVIYCPLSCPKSLQQSGAVDETSPLWLRPEAMAAAAQRQ